MTNIVDVKGVGKQLKIQFNLNGIFTTYDLLTRYPKKYESFEEDSLLLAVDKTNITVKGLVVSIPKVVNHRGTLKSLHFSLLVNHEIVKVVAYRRDYLKDQLLENMEVTVKGKIEKKKRLITAQQILLKPIESELKPIYGLEGIYDSVVLKTIKQILNESQVDIYETLPPHLIVKHHLPNRKDMIKNLHLPESLEDINRSYTRLKYEEALQFQYQLMSQKLLLENDSKPVKQYDLNLVKAFIKEIPFELTKDQKDAVNDIYRDFKKPYPTKRLIQGDVGSGKTIVVGIAVMGAKSSGFQSALMAPTEILAEQHYQFFKQTFKHMKVALLTGSTKDKKTLKSEIKRGELDFIIGTHALVEDDVVFKNLGFVIIDEQHRFGVETRETLKDKGNADVVYLTATPIPRTLAIVLFGDMEVSTIREKPLGRKEIITRYFSNSQEHAIFEHVKKELNQGHKAYFIAPSIDAIDRGETVLNLYERVSSVFKDNEVYLIHGKLSSAEKNQTLEAFAQSKGAILVSTTVVEVGLDVKEATIMVIFDGQYFGLSQLHQLRGRVGRSDIQSYCYVLSSESDIERLSLFSKTTDGFLLSEYDLKQRGPGEFLGVRQSGMLKFTYASIADDFDLFLKAKQDALMILKHFEWNERYRKMNGIKD
ncbi:MAG: ATP-dependent DNA helicase RecG [Acholeplasma sp.]|nr:ATP-dependent DNA helicase RecG [Acholeplasma sp.]